MGLSIGKIAMFVVALVVAGALLPIGIVSIANTTALTDGGVDASTIAIYGVIAIVAVVAFLVMLIRSAMS